MRTCTLCQAPSPDSAHQCIQCGADLEQHSATAIALSRLRKNPRVGRIRLIVADDTCPACRMAAGEYDKDKAPALPVPGCSHVNGCRCFYEPSLLEIYP